ncbi:MAG: hypothetical protein RLZZ584_4259 [Pseudomonadota bacterium]|jgi:hypothetical protein
MQWTAPASGKPGRPVAYSDAAVQCCLTMKVLFGLPLRQTQGFMHSLLKLSGLDWQAPDYSTISRRQWRKVHLGIDAQTLEIRAIEVTDHHVGDAPMLPELLGQIPPDEPVLSVSGDGAYDTQACHDAIALRGAQAVIPTRKNAQPWEAKRPGAARSGSAGAAITAARWWRPRCAASSCWANG